MFLTETVAASFLEKGCSYNNCSTKLPGESVARIFEIKKSVHF